MNRTSFISILTILAFVATTAICQVDLSALSDRGWEMYYYDAACAVASDSIVARNPDTSRLQHFVAKKDGSTWFVAFGKLDSTKNQFLIAYEVEVDKKSRVGNVIENVPAIVDSGWYLRATRALELSQTEFGTAADPYNTIVLPEDDGTVSVYFVPAETTRDTILIGGDIRFQVTADGMRLLKRTELHKTLLKMPAPPEGVVSGMHSHVLSDDPVESDVFYVLRGKPRIEQYIVGQKATYRIDRKGKIHEEDMR